MLRTVQGNDGGVRAEFFSMVASIADDLDDAAKNRMWAVFTRKFRGGEGINLFLATSALVITERQKKSQTIPALITQYASLYASRYPEQNPNVGLVSQDLYRYYRAVTI